MVRFCLDRAAECRRKAERAKMPPRKRSWLEMAGRWFFLARSYDSQRRGEEVVDGDARQVTAAVVVLERSGRDRGTLVQLVRPDRARG
jgi:hypothetical protein